MANKVTFGLSNVHYSVITYGVDGTPSYATPAPIKGAVNLDLSINDSSNTFYADNVAYFVTAGMTTYEGDLEIAYIPDAFRTAVLGEVVDSADVYAEYSDTNPKEFALLFQFEGDEKARRYCLYRCSCTKPNITSATTEETVEPQTETLTITAMPRQTDSLIKSRCDEDSTAYAGWFTAVAEPIVP